LRIALCRIDLHGSPVLCQYSANIQGTVLDQNGAALNGAHLRLTNASTGVEASAVSNATGGIGS